MSIQLVGMSHRTAPVEVRERLAFSEEVAGELARELVRGDALEEALVLSTCNRVEFLANGEKGALRGEVFRCIQDWVNGLPVGDELFYSYDGRGAVRHVFRVASSLDSIVVGEPQILGQVRDAYQRAKDAGAIGGFLDRLLSHAVHVARRVRNETEIGKMAVSVSYVAVELARKIFGDLEGRSVLLIGAGEMAEAAAEHLHGAGAGHLYLTNRTSANAERLASAFGGEVVEFDRLLELLQHVDIVLSSTGAPGHILSKSTAQGVIAARRNNPIFLVDIAVPRDIDPEINDVDNMFVYDIDDLQQVASANMRHRQHEAEAAERIVEDEVDRVLRHLQAQSAGPAILSLKERLEAIRRGEIDRHRSKLRDLSADQRDAVEALTRGIMNKVAHDPIREFKRSAADPRSRVSVADFRRLFGLDQ